MTGPSGGLFRNYRTVQVGALLLIALLAWTWLLLGAGMGMTGPDMGGMAMPGPRIEWSLPRFFLTWSMWAVMMVAMMLPSAAPVVLLYGQAARKSGLAAGDARFLLGYLIAWSGYSLIAALLQTALQQSGLVSAMSMAVTAQSLTAVLLVIVGLYQLSPWKGACLSHCRNPAEFIARHHRSGPLGMGVIHGSWCVGCCWALMLLLFVGGVMNLLWIAALTLLVAAEKLLPFGRWIPFATAPIFLAWGAVLLAR